MNTWIPITEKMPISHTRVLVTHEPYAGHKEVCIASWFTWYERCAKKEHICWHQDTEWAEVNGDAGLDHEDLNVTHWKPLIDPA